jgi:hypothetical protein
VKGSPGTPPADRPATLSVLIPRCQVCKSKCFVSCWARIRALGAAFGRKNNRRSSQHRGDAHDSVELMGGSQIGLSQMRRARVRLFRLTSSYSATSSPDGVGGDRSGAEHDQGERDRSQREREFVSTLSEQAVLPVNLGDGDAHVDEDGKRGAAREKSEDQEDAASELGQGGDVAEPGGKSQAGDVARVFVHVAVDFVGSVADEHDAQGEAEREQGQGLHAVEVAQVGLRG